MPTQPTSGPTSTHNYESIKKDDPALTGDEKILAEAHERFRLCVDYNAAIRAEALEDLKFFKGDQWQSTVLRERTDDRRPSLTVNKIPVFCQQVINDIRMNSPSIKIRPVDSVTDPATAEVIQGMIRHVQSNCDVKSAIDTALEYAVICGQGFLRIRTDYVDENSMDQEIIVERISNPLSVYFPIPLCKNADWSDAPYCFIRTSISKDEFKRKYGKKAMNEVMSWQGHGVGDCNWTEEDTIWLAEYYTVEEEEATLYQLEDGTTTLKKPENAPWAGKDGTPFIPVPAVVKERPTTIRKVVWRLISEQTILETEEWPSKYIPVIPVLGIELNIDGIRSYISLVRNAKDPQRMYNYFSSMKAEVLALAPKSPWLVATGQIENFEDTWRIANVKNLAYLEYNPISSQGVAVPPPQRLEPPNIPMAAVEALKTADNDIMATTGIFQASLGQPSNEKSGKAIIARQRQGDTATYHFVDNLTRAIRHMGRIFVDLIPHIYDTPRVVRVLGEDQADKVMLVNQMHRDEESNEDKIYDLSVGRYDVTVETGPSYESRRVEAAETLTQILQAVPSIGQFSSDILVRNLDFPGATELAERLKRTIPPELLEDPGKNPNKISESEIRMIVQDLQALQQQLQQAGVEKQAMADMIRKYEEALKSKQQTEQIKADTAVIRANAEIQKAQMQLQGQAMQHEHEDTHHAVDAAIKISTRKGAAEPNLSSSYQPEPAPYAESY